MMNAHNVRMNGPSALLLLQCKNLLYERHFYQSNLKIMYEYKYAYVCIHRYS